MLRRDLRALPDLRGLDSSYRAALFARYDVFHVHWPEILLGGSSPLRKLLRQVLLVLFLLRLSAPKTPIVRTVHNLDRPEGLRRHEYGILSWIDKLTALRIRLNPHTPVPSGAPSVIIPHGHYREWYAPYERRPAHAGRLAYVGLIRRYKGVERLIQAFRGTVDEPDGPGLSLEVAGSPSTSQLAETVQQLAQGDPRVHTRLHFLSDAELVTVVSSAELVVLPYRLMHNSGGALACLSLDRPVLVPDNQVNRDLAEEVGPGWVHTFTGDLTAEHLTRTLAAVRGADKTAPDLSHREWSGVAALHLAAYRAAHSAVRR